MYSYGAQSGMSPKALSTLIVAGTVTTCNIVPHCSRETLEVQIKGDEAINEVHIHTHTDANGNTSTSTTNELVYYIYGQVLSGSRQGESISLTNRDSLLEWKWNSSEIEADIKSGSCFKLKTYGWRVGWLGMYENIVSAKSIPCEAKVVGSTKVPVSAVQSYIDSKATPKAAPESAPVSEVPPKIITVWDDEPVKSSGPRTHAKHGRK